MDDLACDGSETDIIDCKFPGWGQHDCGHSEDASVDCGKFVLFVDILLLNSSNVTW